MERLKQLITYVIMAVILASGFVWIPRLTSRAQVPSDYQEIVVPDIEHYPSYSFDASVSIGQLHPGDAVCYSVPIVEGGSGSSSNGNGFGWIAAVPGDEVQFAKGQLLVNGKVVGTSGPISSDHPDVGPLIIPENYLYVVTTGHITDSVVRGPFPAAAVRGRLASFP